MGDDLTVSGGGSTAVATDELFAAAQQLNRLALEAVALRAEVSSIDRIVSLNGLAAWHAPVSAARAESDIDQARIVLAEVEAGARAIGWALSTAAEGYGFIERFISGVGVQLSGEMGSVVGSLFAGSALASPIAGMAARIGLRGLVDGGFFTGDPAAVIRPPHESNELLTNPLTTSAVRAAVMGVDDAILTGSGVPGPVAQFLGDGGLGLAGLAFASSALTGVGASAGLLSETPVRPVAEQSRSVAGPPTSFADRLARVPDPASQGGSQVVVERYTMPTGPDHYQVYIAGTVTFSPEATTEPWDMTSNLANAAGDGGGSLNSVVQAMRAAGVDESSPVQLTGYSQGGGTAARLAATGDFTVVGLTTFGGATGQVPIPTDIPTVIVEHSDDIVPALGGVQLNQQALIIERDVFAGRELPTNYAVPAHHLEYYQETARLMDAAASDQVTAAAARLNAFGAGATAVTSTAYRFERVDPATAAGPALAAGGRGR